MWMSPVTRKTCNVCQQYVRISTDIITELQQQFHMLSQNDFYANFNTNEVLLTEIHAVLSYTGLLSHN